MVDTSAPNTVSNIYINTDNGLNGNSIVAGASAVQGTAWTARGESKVLPGWFNTAVLLFAKVSVNYYGRSDAESGYFGGSFHLSSVAQNAPDSSPSNFNYVNR
jgi:hypothetical protein